MNSNNRLGEHYNHYNKFNVNEFNNREYSQNSFNKVYASENNKDLSVLQEPNIEYEELEYYVTVSSRDRDTTNYPNVNNYSIQLPQEFRNISQIELIQAIIPSANNVAAEPYLLLNISELNDVMISSDKNITNSFAILPLAQPVTPNGFIQIDKRIHENTVYSFITPNYPGCTIGFPFASIKTVPSAAKT
jgi:hypothetical protein